MSVFARQLILLVCSLSVLLELSEEGIALIVDLIDHLHIKDIFLFQLALLLVDDSLHVLQSRV